jgi:hypothetical protein
MDWAKELQRPHGLPRGAELARRVKLARQGDKLAALEVHAVLATDLRRGTLPVHSLPPGFSLNIRITIPTKMNATARVA